MYTVIDITIKKKEQNLFESLYYFIITLSVPLLFEIL